MDTRDNALWTRAFPALTAAHIATLRPFGRQLATSPGDVLFDVGDADYEMVVVLAGKTEIIDRTDGADQVLKTSGRGEFHAELGLLTGQTVFVACVVREAGSVLLVPAAGVREAIRRHPVVADVLVPSFAARRQILMRSAAATLTFVGPEDTRTALGLREFADRNRIPHRWLSLMILRPVHCWLDTTARMLPYGRSCVAVRRPFPSAAHSCASTPSIISVAQRLRGDFLRRQRIRKVDLLRAAATLTPSPDRRGCPFRSGDGNWHRRQFRPGTGYAKVVLYSETSNRSYIPLKACGMPSAMSGKKQSRTWVPGSRSTAIHISVPVDWVAV